MLELKNIYKSYDGKKQVVSNLNLTINDGELVVLIGESGCGKTTTMQMINRIIDPNEGEILLNGVNINSTNKNELRRNIGYVIQDIGLFPHKTIAENIATVPSLCKKDPDETNKKVKELMETVDLPYDEYANRYPSELSGGQQQRVGVARALANEPDLILMDEPFSALDPITREQLQDELLRIHDELNKTIVFVTHDIDEAIKLGDRIAIMRNGKIAQYDNPEVLLKNPASDYVADFIGHSRLWKTPNLLRAKDVMNSKITQINPNRTVLQAIELMREHQTAILAVCEKNPDHDKTSNKIVGLVGINRANTAIDGKTKIKDIMKKDFTRVHPDLALTDVINMRNEKNILFSPVVTEDDRLLGIITNTSILNVLSKIIPGKEEY